MWLFGRSLEHELSSVSIDAKDPKLKERQEEAARTRILEAWGVSKASDAKPKAKPTTAFADPAKR